MSDTDSLHALLNIKEQLNYNLSGSQIVAVLDTLLMSAVTPILENTNFVENTIAELFTSIYSNNRRKYSNVERTDFICKLFTMLATPSKVRKKLLLTELRLERNVWFDMLAEFFKRTKEYEELYLKLWTIQDVKERSKLLKQLNVIERSVFNCQGSLYTTIRNAQISYELSSTFKGYIIEKHVRNACNKSRSAMKHTKLHISQVDLIGNLLLSISKGIDKYDPDRGALTSYIEAWFKDGVHAAVSSHEFGTAYSIPSVQRRKLQNQGQQLLNFYVDLESVADLQDPNENSDMEASLIARQRQHRMSRIVRYADESGIAMLLMGIHYSLNEDEIDKLRATNN